MSQMDNKKNKNKLNPVMTLVILIGLTIILSGILSLFGLEATYNEVNEVTNTYDKVWVSVESLFNLSGIKYIFESTVSNFAAFTPLSMLLITLIGIGIMEKSGFLKTLFNILTRKAQKRTITFIMVLVCILFSIAGDIGYVVMIPLSALIFYHGRRNPLIGIITSFSALTCGTGLSLFLTSVDSSLLNKTLGAAHILDVNYSSSTWGFVIIMFVSILILAGVITAVTEKITAFNVSKYEFKDDKKELRLTKREIRGLLFSLVMGGLYLLIFIYNIIPGLPFSGNLLDYSQNLYIDKLFSSSSFFSQGFVFIITMLFIILGLFYGIGSKSIKNNNDFCSFLTHSLDGIGRTILLILLSSILINIFKKTNIGVVVCAMVSNLIENSTFTGLPLLILFFIGCAISTIFLPNSLNKWTILAGSCVPKLMSNGLSPEFCQVIFRFAEGVFYGLTPIMAYYIIYLAYIEKYNQDDEPITLLSSIKYQCVYSIATFAVLLLVLILWYVIGLPLGIGAMATI